MSRHKMCYTSKFWNISLWFNFLSNSKFVNKKWKISILDNIKLHSHTDVCVSFHFKIFHSIFVFQSLIPATCILIGIYLVLVAVVACIEQFPVLVVHHSYCCWQFWILFLFVLVTFFQLILTCFCLYQVSLLANDENILRYECLKILWC